MTAWALSFGWNWLLVPVAVWFLRGLYKATCTPRLKYLEHSKAAGGWLLRVQRQALLPPWLNKQETWFILRSDDAYNTSATREGDGRTLVYSSADGYLLENLRGVLRVALARDAETEELAK